MCRETFHSFLGLVVQDSNFLTLDSSTDTKFSAHVVVHLPQQRLFTNHIHLKEFVDQLTTKMLSQNKCLVMKENEKQTYLCDTSVYTKNRNFRLYYSSKQGKDVRLEYASYCKFYGEFI